MVILTPIENAGGVVALNLEFNTHLNISKLLSLSLRYKTKWLDFLNIPISMYSKGQKCGTSDFKCQWNLDRYVTFQMCLVMFTPFFVFCFFCTSISCIGVTPIDTYCMSFRYSICHGCHKDFFVFVHVHTNVSPASSCIFSRVSCFYKHSVHSLWKRLAVIELKTLMARHPFKNPLKALVTFQAICFCVFLHLVEKKINKTSTAVNQ